MACTFMILPSRTVAFLIRSIVLCYIRLHINIIVKFRSAVIIVTHPQRMVLIKLVIEGEHCSHVLNMFPVIQIRFLCPCAVQKSFLSDMLVVFAPSVIPRNHARQIKASFAIIEIEYIAYRPVITILGIETVVEPETFTLRFFSTDTDNGIYRRIIA